MTHTYKYRTSLSATQLSYICSLIQSAPAENRDLELLGYLKSYLVKVSAGIVTPGVILTGSAKDKVIDSMGLAPVNGTNNNPVAIRAGYYAKWNNPDTKIFCTDTELLGALTYMWEKDLFPNEKYLDEWDKYKNAYFTPVAEKELIAFAKGSF